MRNVPSSWTESDRRLFIQIAKRKKSEHVLAFTAIAIGVQLFYATEVKLANIVDEEEEEDEEEDDEV